MGELHPSTPKLSKRSAMAQLCAMGVASGLYAPRQARADANKVFGNYDQAGLDAQYDQALHAKNLEQVTGRWRTNSDEVRRAIGEPQRVSYGPTEVEKLDIYRTHARGAPILVFIHGGEWRFGDARGSAYAAQTFVRSGAHFIALDFIDVVRAEGMLDELLKQLRAALTWVFHHAEEFGGDSSKIHIAGHSSGAHLAAALAETDWSYERGLPRDLIKSATCCSGLYDLAAVSLSSRRAYVKFTDDVVQRLSPARHVEKLRCPLVAAYAEFDSDEFQRQSLEFIRLAQARGHHVRTVKGVGYNHFELIETLANPYGLVGRATLDLMGLARG